YEERRDLGLTGDQRRHLGSPGLDLGALPRPLVVLGAAPDLREEDDLIVLRRGAHDRHLAGRIVALHVGDLEELREQLIALPGAGSQLRVLSEASDAGGIVARGARSSPFGGIAHDPERLTRDGPP